MLFVIITRDFFCLAINRGVKAAMNQRAVETDDSPVS